MTPDIPDDPRTADAADAAGTEDALRAELAARARLLPDRHAPYPTLRRRIDQRRRARTAAVVLLVLAGVGTGAGLHERQRHTAPAASTVAGGCGTTPLSSGSAPAWTAAASAPADLPYVVSSEGDAVGFLFANPLRAGHPHGSQNKILWMVRDDGSKPLTISARPLQASSPVVRHQEPGIGGGRYPSITDVPTPGCWRLTLDWGNRTATVDLLYTPGA